MTDGGSPFAPHSADETKAMLETIGAADEEDLFDVPDAVRFDGSLDIDGTSERDVQRDVTETLARTDDLDEFLGRGHYDHYVPSIVDHLADRSEFLTSYTQYQPEVAQGFLQALFEYQSIVVELTGLDVANASMYDHATALGEAALLADRVRETTGHRVLVPDLLRAPVRNVLENYVSGPTLAVESYPSTDANVDVDGLGEMLDDDVAMVYVESPNDRGAIEERLGDVASLAHDHDALACLGSDPVALALLEEPAAVGMDVVVGDAATLGLGAAHGTGLGLFACREDYLRQVPGRLVGASTDADGRRAYTLTLQTREQHIRRERATSNICTNQAWVSLRTAMHAALLGADGLLELAEDCVRRPREFAERLADVDGVVAPADDRHHFRELVIETEPPAAHVAEALLNANIAVHVVGEHEIQVCLTETNEHAVDDLVAALEVAA